MANKGHKNDHNYPLRNLLIVLQVEEKGLPRSEIQDVHSSVRHVGSQEICTQSEKVSFCSTKQLKNDQF